MSPRVAYPTERMTSKPGARRTLRPRVWRLAIAAALVVIVAGLGIADAVMLPHTVAGRALWASLWVLALPLLWYSWVIARAVVIEPGARIRFRSVFGARRTVPVDDALEVVVFAAPERAGAAAHVAGGPPEQRWMLLRSHGRTALRLSGDTWSPSTLLEFARLAPATGRVLPATTTRGDLDEQFPDDSWIARHPRFEVVGFILPVVLAAVPTLLAIRALLSLLHAVTP